MPDRDGVIDRMAEDLRRGTRQPDVPLDGDKPTQEPPPKKDDGPPRILGVDIENRGAILPGGVSFPLSGPETDAIIRICLKALKRSQAEGWKKIATHHKVSRMREKKAV